MNFNVDRIAQLAGLSSAGGGASGTLNESAGRSSRPATTYDRVVEELQVRGLEMFYSPEQINEAIRTESRLLREEREMEGEAYGEAYGQEMHEEEDVEDLLEREAEEMAAADEGIEDMPQGTTIKTPKGTELKVIKGASTGASALAEAKLRKLISTEVERVLAEMDGHGDTSWMYQDGVKPKGRTGGATMGFAGVGFKR
jgi:hypothetical protein